MNDGVRSSKLGQYFFHRVLSNGNFKLCNSSLLTELHIHYQIQSFLGFIMVFSVIETECSCQFKYQCNERNKHNCATGISNVNR